MLRVSASVTDCSCRPYFLRSEAFGANSMGLPRVSLVGAAYVPGALQSMLRASCSLQVPSVRTGLTCVLQKPTGRTVQSVARVA